MIPKIICFLFGHKRIGWTTVAIDIEQSFHYKKCPRCGTNLEN